MKPLKLYDPNMSLIAILENATGKGYTKKLNDLWQAKFSMPANDPKAKLCTHFRIVELFDGEDRIDLFRILPSAHSSDENSEIISFNCEHVLATLVDDLLFQCHERLNFSTRDVLTYLLTFQSTLKWKLGRVDFNYFFSYKWESENILASLFSVPQPFVDEYQWTWDTTTFPWTLNLITPDSEIKNWIRYGRNLVNVEKRSDPTNLCTRLYGLGYGEGVNQLTISGVNGGVPYIDSDTIGTYGIISRIFADTTEENAATLKGKMEAILEGLKIPRLEYSVGAAHLWQITDKSIDDFYLGAFCRTIDKEDDLTFTARVIAINKPDIDGAPGDVNIEIANSPEDVAKSISSLANRQRINEVYAQGATNVDSNDYQDNCDSEHPATVKFYIPNECVRINKCLLSYETDYFRAYETGAADGGGGVLVTAAVDNTYAAGAYDTYKIGNELVTGQTILGGTHINDMALPAGSHSHNIHFAGQAHTTDSDGEHSHDVLSHGHFISHEHEIEIPDHTHDIEHGIFEFGYLPTALIIKVDGNVIPYTELNGNDIDIISFLSTSGGKISKGTWHTIEIFPNTSANNPLGLARITASVVKQIFIQSRGGGNF